MFIQVNPVYGRNYKAGQVYFTYTIDSKISEGVTFFTCKDVKANEELMKISHCGIVIDEGIGIAALAEHDSFTYQDLNELFDNPKTRIFFKEPKLLDSLGSNSIIKQCKFLEGTQYNYRLASGFALTNLWIMRKLFSDQKRKSILKSFDEFGKLICSQAVMNIMCCSGMTPDQDFIKSPYEVLCHEMFKEWKL